MSKNLDIPEPGDRLVSYEDIQPALIDLTARMWGCKAGTDDDWNPDWEDMLTQYEQLRVLKDELDGMFGKNIADYGVVLILDSEFEDEMRDDAYDRGAALRDDPVDDFVDWEKYADYIRANMYTSITFGDSCYQVKG